MVDAVGKTAGIVDHKVCRFSLFFQWKLTRFTSPQFSFVPAAIFDDSGEAGFERHFDKHQSFAEVVPAGFQHHCRVQKDDVVVCLVLPYLTLYLPANLGMDDRLQSGE